MMLMKDLLQDLSLSIIFLNRITQFRPTDPTRLTMKLVKTQHKARAGKEKPRTTVPRTGSSGHLREKNLSDEELRSARDSHLDRIINSEQNVVRTQRTLGMVHPTSWNIY